MSDLCVNVSGTIYEARIILDPGNVNPVVQYNTLQSQTKYYTNKTIIPFSKPSNSEQKLLRDFAYMCMYVELFLHRPKCTLTQNVV